MPRIKELCDATGIRVECWHVPGGMLIVFHRGDPFGDVDGEGASSRVMTSDRVVHETIQPASTIHPLSITFVSSLLHGRKVSDGHDRGLSEGMAKMCSYRDVMLRLGNESVYKAEYDRGAIVDAAELVREGILTL